MALITPIVNSIPAFDATADSLISFIANGGDQIVKNEIKIIINNDQQVETVVYQNTAVTFALSQTVPANTLTNGVYYKVAFRTYDALNNVSSWSNYQPFYCYSTPVLTVNMSENQTLTTSAYNLILNYNQTENEKINYAVIKVYNSINVKVLDSGNLYNTGDPPIDFTYRIEGLNNLNRYTLEVAVVTIQDTIVTKRVTFNTNYHTSGNPDFLIATVDNCNGYIYVESKPLVQLEAISNPSDPIYIENDTMIDLRSTVDTIDNLQYSSWVKWEHNLDTGTSFLFRLWFYPARVGYKIFEFKDVTGTHTLYATFNRSNSQDYISIRMSNGSRIDVPLLYICNGKTKIFLWIKITNTNWEVRAQILETTSTVLEWNDTSNNNIEINTTSDIKYLNQDYGEYVAVSEIFVPLSVGFDNLIIGNGIYDELNLTRDTTIDYTTVVPAYDILTILACHFNGTLDSDYPNYTKILLKRKTWDSLSWVNLVEVNFDTPDKEHFVSYTDYYVPTGESQIYALTVYIDDIPSEDYTVEIIPQWNRIFINDRNTNFALNYAVIYSNHNQNIQNGILMPIGATYPMVIQNAEGNYRSGSLQFKVLGYQFEIDKKLNRQSIVKQTNDILAFLTNKKPKCIKDYNGNIFICRVINSPQISYDANWGNGVSVISFDWVEQGKYNNWEDMIALGLVDYV